MAVDTETSNTTPIDANDAYQGQVASPHYSLDIFNLATVGMGIVDPSGYWLRTNPVLTTYFGYSEDEFLGTPVLDLIHPKDLRKVQAKYKLLLAGDVDQVELELRCLHRSGAPVWVNAHGSALRMPGRDDIYVLVQIRDLTDLKASEHRLQRRDEIYRMIVRNLPAAAVALFDRRLRYRVVEGSGFDAVGMRAADLEGKTIWEVWPPERCAEIEPHYRAALAGIPAMFETVIGERRFEVRVVPVPAPEGGVAGGILTAMDITDRIQVERELRAIAEALIRSNRELEEFAFVASHDLRAPLVSLNGMATILFEEHADKLDVEGRYLVARILANAGNMQTLLDELLDISRVGRDESAFEPVDLALVVRHVIDQQKFALGERDAILECDLDGVIVEASRARMLQLFTNLIDNAVKYTPPERSPRIVIDAAAEGDAWAVSVADNGVGIPPDYRETVFGIFQRLRNGKELNPSGAGMGLALVARIVALHGGEIAIEPGISGGSTFRFSLPRAASCDERSAREYLTPTGILAHHARRG